MFHSFLPYVLLAPAPRILPVKQNARLFMLRYLLHSTVLDGGRPSVNADQNFSLVVKFISKSGVFCSRKHGFFHGVPCALAWFP
jgi:hypothetical protein